jgi:hypothetical protein
LVGPTKAKALIAAETSRRSAIVSARQTRARLLAESIDAAKQDVQMLTSRLPSDDLIRGLKERADAMQALLQKGQVARVTVLQVQGQLADAEQRRQDSVARLSEAKQRLGSLGQDKVKMDTDTRGELETAINTIEQQITGASREADTSGGVLGALKVQYGAPSEVSTFSYQIVRQTPNGPVEHAARGMTPLYPGDLVRIVTPEDGQNPATAPETVTQPGFKNASFGCK